MRKLIYGLFLITACSFEKGNQETIAVDTVNSNLEPLVEKDSITSEIIDDNVYLITKSFDTSINGKIFLRDPKSIINSFGDISNHVIDSDNEAPYAYVLNRKKDEYLKLTVWYGDPRNTFSYFEVGYHRNSDMSKNYVQSSFSSFKTENGIHLGLAKDSLVLKRGEPSTVIKIETGEEQLTYLNPQDQLYESKYYFKEDSLVRYSFGYVYP